MPSVLRIHDARIRVLTPFSGPGDGQMRRLRLFIASMKSQHRLTFLVLLATAAVSPAQSPVTNFSLKDENSASHRRAATSLFVSPRDYFHQITAWYFGHEN